MEMTRSKKFEIVKYYYESGLWKMKRIRNAVEREWITAEEFEIITGVPYQP